MSRANKDADGAIPVQPSDDGLARDDRVVDERPNVPAFEAVETYRWTTDTGYEIVEVEYWPAGLANQERPVIGRRKENELRGYPCPRCGSTETAAWGVKNVPDNRVFVCRSCNATGQWVLECARRPSPVHLDDECACAPNCGCVPYSPESRLLGPMHKVTPTAETTMTVPTTHQLGCPAAIGAN